MYSLENIQICVCARARCTKIPECDDISKQAEYPVCMLYTAAMVMYKPM